MTIFHLPKFSSSSLRK